MYEEEEYTIATPSPLKEYIAWYDNGTGYYEQETGYCVVGTSPDDVLSKTGGNVTPWSTKRTALPLHQNPNE